MRVGVVSEASSILLEENAEGGVEGHCHRAVRPPHPKAPLPG